MIRPRLMKTLAFALATAACGTPAADSASDNASYATDPIETAKATLQSLAAFPQLTKIQQQAMTRLVVQPTNIYSKAVRRDLMKLVADPTFKSAAVDEQAKKLWGITKAPTVLNGPPNVEGLWDGALPLYGQVMQPIVPAGNTYTLSAATVGHRLGATPPRDPIAYEKKFGGLLVGSNAAGLIGPDDFDSTGEDAALFTLNVAGQTMNIGAPLMADGTPPDPNAERTYPADTGSNGQLIAGHSVQEVARALADIPHANRQLFDEEVDLIGHRAPVDSIVSHLYHRPEMRGYMMAGTNPVGFFHIFPKVATEAGPVDPSTMVHESGHTWSYKTFGLDPTSAGWTAWRAAIAADGLTVSWYAASGPDPALPGFLEDVAETVLVYCAVRSTGEEGRALATEMKAIFPNRWAILDRDFPKE
jgi:hypothetical protein